MPIPGRVRGLQGSRAPCGHPGAAGQPPLPRAASEHGLTPLARPSRASPTPRRPAARRDGCSPKGCGVPGGGRRAPGRAEAGAGGRAPPAVRAVARARPAVGARAAAAPCRVRAAPPQEPGRGEPLRERAGGRAALGPRGRGTAGYRPREVVFKNYYYKYIYIYLVFLGRKVSSCPG